MTLLLGVSVSLSSTAAATPHGIHLTVYPDGSVGIAFDLYQSTMLQPGTEPTVILSERATSAGGQTTITATETESLPSNTLNQAPYNYSASMTSSGSHSNGISKGSITVQALPGVSFPGASLEASYHGDSDSLSASGNTTLQYGTYGSGQSETVVNATTISQDLLRLQSQGLNFSSIQRLLANVSATFPQGNFSLTSFGLHAVYGSSSATVYGDISLTGNMTALPFLVASLYLGLTGLTSSTTATSSIGATAVCNPQSPAACAITLESTGTASTSIIGCRIENQHGNSTVGTLSPSDQTVPATGSATVTCTLPVGTPVGPTGSFVNGTLDLTNGAYVEFLGTWNSSAQLPTPTITTTSITPASTNTESTTVSPFSHSMLDLFSVYSKVISSLHDYAYTMSYASGIMEVSETGVATQNLNLDQAMPLLALYAANQNATSSVVQFLNSTRVDISSLSVNVSEAQSASGAYVTNASMAGLTIYPQIVKSGGVFNESGLFDFLQSTSTNVTVTGGTNSEGSVNITVPAGLPPPTSSTADSKAWTGVNMSSLRGLELSVTQASTTSTTSSAGTTWPPSTTTSSASTTGGGGIPEFSVQLSVSLLATVAIIMSYVLVRHRVRMGRQPPG